MSEPMQMNGYKAVDVDALVAAAPDLLEALRNLTDYVEPSTNPEVYPGEAELIQAARKAIAKAEGRLGSRDLAAR